MAFLKQLCLKLLSPPKTAPAKRASRTSHSMNLAPRKSDPEKSHPHSDIRTKRACRRSAPEKSTAFRSKFSKKPPPRVRFSWVVKIVRTARSRGSRSHRSSAPDVSDFMECFSSAIRDGRECLIITSFYVEIRRCQM